MDETMQHGTTPADEADMRDKQRDPRATLLVASAGDAVALALARNPDLATKFEELDVAIAKLDEARAEHAAKVVQTLQHVPLHPYQRVAGPTSRRERRALARKLAKRVQQLKREAGK
jgi:hypothetical protein